MGFREWTEHYEKEQESQRQQIGDLTKIVSSLSADVRTLVENQRGMFSRMNRPQGPIIFAGLAIAVSAIGVLATFIALTVSPIKDELIRLNASELRYRESTDNVLTMLADNQNELHSLSAKRTETDRWLERFIDMNKNDIDWLHDEYKKLNSELIKHGSMSNQ